MTVTIYHISQRSNYSIGVLSGWCALHNDGALQLECVPLAGMDAQAP